MHLWRLGSGCKTVGLYCKLSAVLDIDCQGSDLPKLTAMPTQVEVRNAELAKTLRGSGRLCNHSVTLLPRSQARTCGTAQSGHPELSLSTRVVPNRKRVCQWRPASPCVCLQHIDSPSHKSYTLVGVQSAHGCSYKCVHLAGGGTAALCSTAGCKAGAAEGARASWEAGRRGSRGVLRGGRRVTGRAGLCHVEHLLPPGLQGMPDPGLAPYAGRDESAQTCFIKPG